MTHDAFGGALVVTTEPKKLFSWKYAGILVGVNLGMAAVAFDLTRLRRKADLFLPSWRQILTLIGLVK